MCTEFNLFSRSESFVATRYVKKTYNIHLALACLISCREFLVLTGSLKFAGTLWNPCWLIQNCGCIRNIWSCLSFLCLWQQTAVSPTYQCTHSQARWHNHHVQLVLLSVLVTFVASNVGRKGFAIHLLRFSSSDKCGGPTDLPYHTLACELADLFDLSCLWSVGW